MIAERLGWPAATLGADPGASTDGTVTIRRDADVASLTVEADLPAVVSVTDQSGEARYPSMKGILAAKKKPVETWDLADLGRRPGVGRPGRRLDPGAADRAPAAQGGRPGRPRRRRGRSRRRWSTSWPPASTSEHGTRRSRMSEVLVVAELVDGAVAKPTLELLTLARRIGRSGRGRVRRRGRGGRGALGEYGATAGAGGDRPGHRRVPGRAQGRGPGTRSRRQRAPAAVLISSTPEGKEIAGRLAVKLGSGLITDATDIARRRHRPPSRCSPATGRSRPSVDARARR